MIVHCSCGAIYDTALTTHVCKTEREILEIMKTTKPLPTKKCTCKHDRITGFTDTFSCPIHGTPPVQECACGKNKTGAMYCGSCRGLNPNYKPKGDKSFVTSPVVSGDKECDTCHHFLKLHYGSDNTLCVGCDGDRTCKPPVTSSPDDVAGRELDVRLAVSTDSWEERFDSENWHAIEGPNGMCACGNEKGNCKIRLKSFIKTLLQEDRKRTKIRFEILEGRMRACNEEHPDMHQVSLREIPGWIEEFES